MSARGNPGYAAARALTVTFTSLSLLALSGCQPHGTAPGLWLRGELVTDRVTDWSFTNEHLEVYIQTGTRYLLPHSNTIWCVEQDGELYLGSYDGGTAREASWVRNIRRNPEARLKIGDDLYEIRLEEIEDEGQTATLYDALLQKYQVDDAFETRLGTWWFYRAEQIVDATEIGMPPRAPEGPLTPRSR